MRYAIRLALAFLASVFLLGARGACEGPTQEDRDRETVQEQQSQYAKRQPVPVYDYSLERHLVIQLYGVRNRTVVTHSVWRSDYGVVEGDCPSMGYGLPYDTSLTNPWQAQRVQQGGVAIGQPEPNGVYASTNTSATWIICVGANGVFEPHYVEAKVTVYPGPVKVDYATNRVTRVGAAAVVIAPGAK